MKLKDCKNWEAVKVDDRVILKADLVYMSADQRAALENLEVSEGVRKNFYKTVTTNLERIRLAAGLSQSKLAEASGVSVRMIQHYEQKVKDLNKAQGMTVYKLAQALGCNMEDLIEK